MLQDMEGSIGYHVVVHADAFDEAELFRAIAGSGARVLLIGRRGGRAKPRAWHRYTVPSVAKPVAGLDRRETPGVSCRPPGS
jgi:hypothetical protein